MAAMDFNKALDVKASEVKAVPVPPIGHYVWQVTAIPAISDGEEWQSVEFRLQAVSVFEDANDVDADELKVFGNVTSIRNRKSFMFNKITGTETDLISFQNQIKRFMIDHLKIEDGDNMSLRQLMNASVNKRFVGQLTHKPDKNDQEVIRANVGRTAPLTD
jgi:hypothetical protein